MTTPSKINIVAVRIVDSHAEYAIERDNNPATRVWRRYRDFENLRKSLLLDKTLKHLVPELPPKQSWWASRSTAVTNQRKVALEAFLRKIEEDQLVVSGDKKIAWDSFFDDNQYRNHGGASAVDSSTYLDSSQYPLSPQSSTILESSTINPFEEASSLQNSKLEREIESVRSATSDEISKFLKALEEEREESRALRERVAQLENELARIRLSSSNISRNSRGDEASIPSLESDHEDSTINKNSVHASEAASFKSDVIERPLGNSNDRVFRNNDTTVIFDSDVSGISSVHTDVKDSGLDQTQVSSISESMIEEKSTIAPFNDHEVSVLYGDNQMQHSVIMEEDESALSDVSAIPHVPEESAFDVSGDESYIATAGEKFNKRPENSKPPLPPGQRSVLDDVSERHPVLTHTRTPAHVSEQARPSSKPERANPHQASALSSVASISGLQSVVADGTNDYDDAGLKRTGSMIGNRSKRRPSLGASRGDRSSLGRSSLGRSAVNASSVLEPSAADRSTFRRTRPSLQSRVGADSKIESTLVGGNTTIDGSRTEFGATTVITSSTMIDEADTPSFQSDIPSIFNRTHLSDNDSTLEALVQSMLAKAGSSETVAQFGSRSILDLCCESPHALETLGKLGACEAVLLALKSFPDSEAVALEACGAVFNLSFNEDNARELKRLGAVPLLLSALSKLGPNNPGVAYASISALLNLSSKDEKRKIYRSGGVKILMEILNLWGTVNVEVATEACALLRNLAEDATMARELGNYGANDAVMLVLHSPLPAQSKALALECVLCVRNLSVDDINRSVLCATKANVRQLLRAIESHVADPNMALQAAFTLRNLASKNQINAQLLGECGACELLLLIAQNHPQHPEEEELAYALAAAIWNLCFCPAATSRLLKHGLPRYLVNAAKQYGAKNSKVAAVQCGAVFRAVCSGGNAARKALNRAGIQGALRRISPNENLAAALEMVTESWT